MRKTTASVMKDGFKPVYTHGPVFRTYNWSCQSVLAECNFGILLKRDFLYSKKRWLHEYFSLFFDVVGPPFARTGRLFASGYLVLKNKKALWA